MINSLSSLLLFLSISLSLSFVYYGLTSNTQPTRYWCLESRLSSFSVARAIVRCGDIHGSVYVPLSPCWLLVKYSWRIILSQEFFTFLQKLKCSDHYFFIYMNYIIFWKVKIWTEYKIMFLNIRKIYLFQWIFNMKFSEVWTCSWWIFYIYLLDFDKLFDDYRLDYLIFSMSAWDIFYFVSKILSKCRLSIFLSYFFWICCNAALQISICSLAKLKSKEF